MEGWGGGADSCKGKKGGSRKRGCLHGISLERTPGLHELLTQRGQERRKGIKADQNLEKRAFNKNRNSISNIKRAYAGSTRKKYQ